MNVRHAIRTWVHRWGRGNLGLIAATVVVNGWVTRALLQRVSYPNDAAFHEAMVDWASGRVGAGHLPLDGWFNRLSSGLAQFHHYQSLPHSVTGLLGWAVGAESAFVWTNWALWTTWPIAVAVAARAFGLRPRAAALAAVCSPLLVSATGYGFELFSYSWLGNGLWSQLWGMWVAPLALAWSARAVAEGRRFGRAGAAVALTVACHLPTAWFVLLCLGLWPLVRPSQWRQRVPRTIVLAVGSLAMSAWVLVPLLTDQWATNDSAFDAGGDFPDSFGWRKVGGWLVHGDLTDRGRLPVIALLGGAGLVLALLRWRREPTRWARELPAVLLLGTILFVGRDPFAPIIDLLPGADQVFLHRYHVAIQLVVILLAGVALDRLGAVVFDAVGRHTRVAPSIGAGTRRWALVRSVGAAVLALVILTPALAERARFANEDASWIAQQAEADTTRGAALEELLGYAADRGPGKVYAGRINNWGDGFLIGRAPIPIMLGYYPVSSIGFNLRIASLSADVETYLDDTDAAQLRRFGVRWVIQAANRQRPVGTHLVALVDGLALYEVPDSGWISVVDTVGEPLRTTRAELGETAREELAADRPPWQARVVNLEGRTPAEPTASDASSSPGPPGTVSESTVDLDGGRFEVDVEMGRPGVVTAATNFHPRWEARVDGEVVPTQMVTPSFLGVAVPEGRHRVEFVYRAYPLYWWWLLVAAIALAALYWWPRRRGTGPSHVRPAVVASALAVGSLGLAGCAGGPGHRVARAPVARTTQRSLSEATRSTLMTGFDLNDTLGSLLAADRPTVLLVTRQGCASCEAALLSLRERAFDAPNYSLLLVGVPRLDSDLADAAIAAGVSVYATSSIDELLATGDEAVVVALTPDGGVLGTWPLDEFDHDDLASALAD
ncbi:hypothetical protein [Candidatus Microthrix parvicella]|uniref:Uncharacterized protein n=1 Tax=Candidatus Neomicrothrix parvicella RN1 TaxID=1229780 RepID=R4Z065_9ACTN|nr:hypothetical protein [Candidatus Microthrix parvicella]CCM62017.1 membrane hypothetical protein [Candidatus Microthrix parvicella RN1]